MKNLILVLVLLLIPVSAGAFDYDYSYNHTTYTREPDGSYFNNDYRHPVTYEVKGKSIYGSDGSDYTIYDDCIQDNRTGKKYQVNGNIITPLGF